MYYVSFVSAEEFLDSDPVISAVINKVQVYTWHHSQLCTINSENPNRDLPHRHDMRKMYSARHTRDIWHHHSPPSTSRLRLEQRLHVIMLVSCGGTETTCNTPYGWTFASAHQPLGSSSP
jgi:hypothetical protein